MEDVTLVINVKGFILPNALIAREISWIHLRRGIGETVSVFTPNYDLTDREWEIVYKTVKENHGLSFKRFPTDKDPHIRQFFFLRSIKPMVTLISLYVLFVTYLGPLIMRNRKPIELRRLIILYNFSLVGYYAFFLTKGAYFLYQLRGSMFCDSTLDSTESPLIADFYLHGYIMYVVRYVELIDTIFLVLSKKFKMITTLHVFHHAIVPVFGWFGFRSEKSGYLSVFMAINSFIHIIMYVYYAVAALGPEYQKYLWWKKYLTVLQITQFFITTVYIAIMYAVGCVESKFIGLGSSILCVLFFFWFIEFYKRTFSKPQRKVYQNGEEKKLLNDKMK